MKAELKRYTKSGQFSVETTYPNGDKHDLWRGLIAFCAKDYSNNELRQIWKDCNEQLSTMNADDTPLKFKEVMQELTQTILDRGVYVKNRLEVKT